MKIKVELILAMLVISWIGSACSGQQATPDLDHTHPAPPAEFAGKSNPVSQDAAAIETGKELYTANCAACHGAEGHGDGPAAASLNPHPRALAEEIGQMQDDYIYWRISEGGAMAPFHSVMPAWKRILTDEQIWQIIAFIRTFS